MTHSDEFFDSLQYDEEGHILWPDDSQERRRYAEGLFGARVIESIESIADAMVARVDGRWPAPGSMNYEEDIKAAMVLRSMAPEQREAVQALLAETAWLAAYSIFLGLEHFGSGRVAVSVLPTQRGTDGGDPIPVEVVEWPHSFLSWEERFGQRRPGTAMP